MDPAACEELTSKLHGSLPESTETDSGAALALLDRSYSSGGGSSSRDVHGVKQEEEMRRRGSSSSWGVAARVSRKVKEQRARFYIMRRCVHMLVCWRDDTCC